MNIISIASISILGVLLIVFLREIHSGFTLPVSVILCGTILLSIYPMISELFAYSNDLLASSVSIDNLKILYKAIGVAFIIQYTADLCRDCGVGTVASKIEIAGKIYIISLCIPLVKNLVLTINNF